MVGSVYRPLCRASVGSAKAEISQPVAHRHGGNVEALSERGGAWVFVERRRQEAAWHEQFGSEVVGCSFAWVVVRRGDAPVYVQVKPVSVTEQVVPEFVGHRESLAYRRMCRVDSDNGAFFVQLKDQSG